MENRNILPIKSNTRVFFEKKMHITYGCDYVLSEYQVNLCGQKCCLERMKYTSSEIDIYEQLIIIINSIWRSQHVVNPVPPRKNAVFDTEIAQKSKCWLTWWPRPTTSENPWYPLNARNATFCHRIRFDSAFFNESVYW